jgi:predicted transcriptional regulator
MATIKKSELKEVQENNQKQFEIKAALADMVIAKQSYDQRKEALLASWNEASAKQKEIQDRLKESYGEVTIDIQTGEIIEPATENVEQDDNKGDS